MQQRARRAAIGAGVGVALLVLVDLVAFHLGVGERLDASVFNGFGGLRAHPHVSWLATVVAHLCDPVPYVYFCVVPLATALLRRRWDIAVTVAAILIGANVTTQWLKPLLDQRRLAMLVHGPAPLQGAWPSGHATAAMSLVLCVVLAVAPRWRALAAVLGAGFAVGVSYAFLTLGWHYPSDAVGGFLVAFTWTCLGVAAHARYRDWRPLPESRPASANRAASRTELAPIAAGVLGVGLLGIATTLAKPGVVVPYVRAHERFIAGLGVIGTLAIVLATAMVVLLRRSQA